jgi:hypothetical protein
MLPSTLRQNRWIPDFAGMTVKSSADTALMTGWFLIDIFISKSAPITFSFTSVRLGYTLMREEE